MEDLEKRLMATRKPEVNVDSFRRNLRRDLLEAHSAGNHRTRTALLLSLASSVVLAGVALLFVIEPTYAPQVHNLVWRVDDTDGTTDRVMWQDPMAADRALVRCWAERTGGPKPVAVTPVDEVQAYTVSRFRLNDGKWVQVCTMLPVETMVRKVSY